MDIRKIGNNGMSRLLMRQLLAEMGRDDLVLKSSEDYSPFLLNEETGEMFTLVVEPHYIGTQLRLEEDSVAEEKATQQEQGLV